MKSPYFTVGQNLGAKPSNTSFNAGVKQAQPIGQQTNRHPFTDTTKNQNKVDLPSITDKKPHMEYETYKVGHYSTLTYFVIYFITFVSN